MNPIDGLRRWWQERTGEDETPFDGDTPAWIASFFVHLGLVVFLALIWIQKPQREPTMVLSAVDPREQELTPDEFDYSEQDQDKIGAEGEAGLESALALAPVVDPLSQIERDLEITELTPLDISEISQISTAPTESRDFTIKGSVGVGASGVSGAVDHLTQEIMNSLEQRRTLVVWLFDRSLSMKPQRDGINARFQKIYDELGVAEASQNPAFSKHDTKPLLTAVMSFGKDVKYLVEEPTDDLQVITDAINSVDEDPSGLEMVFGSIQAAARKYQKFRTQAPRRNVMIIVVSDEVGSDQHMADDTINICQRNEMPVYVVGVPAPFGSREALFKYVDPDPNYDQSPQWLPVDQGPESVLPENLQLGFADSEGDDLKYLDSGFGPYSLTRLCYETGGIYFAVHPNRTVSGTPSRQTAAMSSRLDQFFDPAIMRNYRPDYVPQSEYQQLLMQNKARMALVKAAEMSAVSPMENPRRQFPKLGEAEFKRSLDLAQQDAARLEPKVESVYQVLKMGEKDRANLASPRWQAGYDLAMGRILAVKVRTEGYNGMLARAKTGLKFEKKNSDTWVLEATDEVTVSSQMAKLAQQSKEYLERVKEQHAGTPWAALAERELKTPLGWKWVEKYTGVEERRRMVANNNNNNNPASDTPRQMAKPKPKREGLKL